MRDFRNSRKRDFSRDRGGRPSMHDAICDDCGKNCEVPFKPTGNKPVYCSNCFEHQGGGRNDRDDRRGGGNSRGFGNDREMHDAICDDCGDDCLVPFRPTGDKPIFCSRCFEDRGNGRDDRGGRDSRGGRDDYRRNDRPERKMYDVVCDECDKDCQVPFSPSSDKPIYCDDCFSVVNKDRMQKGGTAQLQEQVTELNEKMDGMLELMEVLIEALVGETEESDEPEEVEVKEVKEEKPKAKKAKKETKPKAKAASKKKEATKEEEVKEEPKKKAEKKTAKKTTKKAAEKKPTKKVAKKAVKKTTAKKTVKKAAKKTTKAKK